MKDVCILGIETSCDETAAAVVVNGREVKSDRIASQIDIHTIYGGVVPEIASRKHVEKITGVVGLAMKDAGVQASDIDAVAVTYGPGLVGALLVGVSFAKALSFAWKKELIGVHHIEGHICANFIEYPSLTPPFLCLVASGGHSHLVHVREYGEYEIIGQTRDDAACEAFDKVARVLGLGYPGGPAIDRAAREGNAEAFSFPQAKIPDAPYDFSFSGLKSTVLNLVNRMRMQDLARREEASQAELPVADLAASFQKAVVDVLCTHTMEAAREYDCAKIAIAGGVASNTALRAALSAACEAEGKDFYAPKPLLCTDNAAMIASAAYFSYLAPALSQDAPTRRAGLDLNACPNLSLGTRERRFHG